VKDQVAGNASLLCPHSYGRDRAALGSCVGVPDGEKPR